MKNELNTINKKLIIVLGMHRSGTSAITKGLTVLGVSLGNKLMPPAEGINNKGFFEDTEINALNIEILKFLDNDWLTLSPIGVEDFKILREHGYVLRAVELLKAKFEGVEIFGFKDPRVAKLLPFWNEVAAQLQLDVSYLIALRNPISVSRSLQKRDGFSTDYSYLLWTRHLLDSLVESYGKPRLVIDFDRLVKSPEDELTRAANFFSLKVTSNELDDYKNQFLDLELRHTVFEINDLMSETDCPPIVKEMFSRLLNIASDQLTIEDIEVKSEVEKWTIEFDRMKSSLKLIDSQFVKVCELSHSLHERDMQLLKLSQELKFENDQIVELERRLDNQNTEIAVLTHKLLEAKSRLSKEICFYKNFYFKLIEAKKIINEKGGLFRVVGLTHNKIRELGLFMFLKSIVNLINKRRFDADDIH